MTITYYFKAEWQYRPFEVEPIDGTSDGFRVKYCNGQSYDVLDWDPKAQASVESEFSSLRCDAIHMTADLFHGLLRGHDSNCISEVSPTHAENEGTTNGE